MKTKCPNLSDLSKVLGPIDGVCSKNPSKPLCENIFDVQRSELFEVLESLRNSFWNDGVVTETLPFQQPSYVTCTEERPLSPSKRTRESQEEGDDDDDDMSENESRPLISKKRARLTTAEVIELPASKKELKTKKSTPPSPRSLNTYRSLWTAKQSYIREIKSVNCRDSDVMGALTYFYQTRSSDQCRHMSLYLMPVAQAMRRKGIVDMLQKWI